jgi:mannose-6-phosphate isomerase-like protein (cupin superfamily)
MLRVDEGAVRNLGAALAGVTEHWSPLTIATVNDYDVRVVRVLGEFVRHVHADTDEFFLVLDGEFRIRMNDEEVVLRANDTYVVPKGVEHHPYAPVESTLLLFEPSSTVNTGD